MEEPFSNGSSISYRASSTFVPLSQAQDKDNSTSKIHSIVAVVAVVAVVGEVKKNYIFHQVKRLAKDQNVGVAVHLIVVSRL
jgi:hypothetical protein